VRVAALLVALTFVASVAHADTSKLGKELVSIQPKAVVRGKNKLCCGYPLVDDLEWALRFYFMVLESDHDDPSSPAIAKAMRGNPIPDGWVDLYNTMGFYVGRFTNYFAAAVRLEGSALMADGRVLSYAGKCDVGFGTCFDQLDTRVHPFGRGARGPMGRRTLTPFKSVAVDPRLIAIGEPVYLPELDGLPLPDGSIHDGCVRGDDTGGGIKFRKMDFFVVTWSNYKFMQDAVMNVPWVTPHIESPRCEYLRDF
jgi:3D (Asp-Asp-Asp) domain-containing protein